MSKRQAAPKPEDLIKALEEKFNDFKSEIESRFEDHDKAQEEIRSNIEEIKIKQIEDSTQLKDLLQVETLKLNESNDNLRTELTALLQENIGSVKQESSHSAAQIKETIADIDQRIQQDLQGFQTSIEERIGALNQTFSSNIQNISGQVESEADFNEETKAQINTLFSRIDEINEKLYEFEINKKNNLIFYGLAGENRETPSVLIMKINSILKQTLSLRRDIVITKAARMQTGPDVGGCRPIVVTFEDFNDREQVLRKAAMLKGSNIHITEDMSRRVRESRQELRKYMREVKKNCPSSVCNLQYDKLYVNHRCYVWSDVQGRVVQYSPGDEAVERSMSRTLSPSKSSPSALMLKTPSLVNIHQEEEEEEKDEKIKQLEDLVSSLKNEIVALKTMSINNISNTNNGDGESQENEND